MAPASRFGPVTLGYETCYEIVGYTDYQIESDTQKDLEFNPHL
jgi:hypothetical protein